MTLIERLAEQLNKENISYNIDECREGTCLYIEALELSAVEFDEPDEEEKGFLEVLSPNHFADLITVEELTDYIYNNY